MRIPSFSDATKIGDIWPPTRVKMNLTPWLLSTSATISPPCFLEALSTWKNNYIPLKVMTCKQKGENSQRQYFPKFSLDGAICSVS